jgi:hypothetical protein
MCTILYWYRWHVYRSFCADSSAKRLQIAVARRGEERRGEDGLDRGHQVMRGERSADFWLAGVIRHGDSVPSACLHVRSEDEKTWRHA